MKRKPAGEMQFPSGLELKPLSRWPLRLPDATVREVLSRPVYCFGPVAVQEDRGRPAASIVVVSFNNLLFNRLCLESVLLNTAPGFEVIVVDNASTDGTVEYLRELERRNPCVGLRLNRRNLGFPAACNQGLRMARGETLVILNNDTLVSGDWIRNLSRMLNDPAVGMAGPVTNRCGNEAQIDVNYATYGEFREFAARRERLGPEQACELPALNMFCAALRRDVFEEVGPLDERFGIGLFEDEDYSLRLRRAGYRLLCAEHIFVHHFGQASIGKLAESRDYGCLFHANRKQFEDKWQAAWVPHDRRRSADYREQVRRLRSMVAECVPGGAQVLVASRGDEDLLVMPGYATHHFPADRHGEYAGHHPANSEDAIQRLERQRAAGGRYLVVPATMSWWFDHYAGFADHLERNYVRLRRSEAGCLYELGDAKERLSGVPRRTPWRALGVEGHDRRLITVIWPTCCDGTAAARLIAALGELGRQPFNLLLFVGDSDWQGLERLLLDHAHPHLRVAIAAADSSAGGAELVGQGFLLTSGDVVIPADLESLRPGWLERLDAAAAGAGHLATLSASGQGGQVSWLITRQALRAVGFPGAVDRGGLDEALACFASRVDEAGLRSVLLAAGPACTAALPSRTCILVVLHAVSGGARHACEDLLTALSGDYRCLQLLTDVSEWLLVEALGDQRRHLCRYRFSEPWRIDADLGTERLRVIEGICRDNAVDVVNVQHLLCSGAGLIDAIAQLHVPVVATFHDFFAACPSAHLFDDRGVCCGGDCTPGHGECPVDPRFIRQPLPALKHQFVRQHRADMARALERCAGFTAPSEFVRSRVARIFPMIDRDAIRLVPPGCGIEPRSIAVRPAGRAAARVVCLGDLNAMKGAALIAELMRLDAAGANRFEFHFLGHSPSGFQPSRLGGIEHGSYRRYELMEKLSAIAPSFSLIASLCEETYSLTLSESWAAGLPVFASDRGALRERIAAQGGGWLLDPEDAGAFYSGMLAVAGEPEQWDRQVRRIARFPLPTLTDSARDMSRVFAACVDSGSQPRAAEPTGGD